MAVWIGLGAALSGCAPKTRAWARSDTGVIIEKIKDMHIVKAPIMGTDLFVYVESGYIPLQMAEDLAMRYAANMGTYYTPEQVREADENNDGLIDQDEYAAFVRRNP